MPVSKASKQRLIIDLVLIVRFDDDVFPQANHSMRYGPHPAKGTRKHIQLERTTNGYKWNSWKTG
jgi:hypothetical protein